MRTIPGRDTAAMLLGFFLAGHAWGGEAIPEKATLNIYFHEEKVGYEEYSWHEDEEGYLLTVRGRMTAPLVLEVERLTLRLSRDYIPRAFSFKGSVNGMAQEVDSTIQEGVATNKVRGAGRAMDSVVSIRRDALLLPNPIFAPYLVAAKKFGCGPRPAVEFSAYIIPQMEAVGRIEVKAENPCTLILSLGGVQVFLTTDEEGRFKSLLIPAQGLRVAVDGGGPQGP